ncbi:hypothetical protein [Pseudomonas putida]|uniref:hypothetical protein n=1 Tax=Pseudomonas putida TaxID=303 RepID=UPI001EF828DD|nr:hypothetical protein [Pseudomonas putida]
MDFPKSVPNIGLVGGVFVDEDQLAGTPGSLIPSAWGNSITQEVLNVIAAAGLVPSEADVTQLLKAIRAINQAASNTFATATGTANAIVVAFNPAVTTLTDSMVVRVLLVANNTGATTLDIGTGPKTVNGLADAGLQGGELVAGGRAIFMWAAAQNRWILLSCQAGALQVKQGTASSHSVNKSQLGWFSNLIGVNVSTAFTASNLGQFIFVTTAGTTQTLPPLASCPQGSTITFAAFATTTIKGNAAELITNIYNNAFPNSMNLAAGEQITYASNTTNWYIASYVRAEAGAPIGTASNLKMTVATATAIASVTADEIVVGTALGGQSYRLSGYNKPVNLGITGAAGMDTGAAPVNGWVALYAIFNPTTGVSNILAVNSPNTVMPAVYGGANMPAGFTASALLTVVPTNGSGQFKVCAVKGRKIYIQLATVFSGSSIVSNNPVSISGIVPANAIEASGELTVGSSALSTMSLTIHPDASIVGQQSMTTTVGAGQALTLNYTGLPISTVQQLLFTSSSTAGTPTFNVYIASYSI